MLTLWFPIEQEEDTGGEGVRPAVHAEESGAAAHGAKQELPEADGGPLADGELLAVGDRAGGRHHHQEAQDTGNPEHYKLQLGPQKDRLLRRHDEVPRNIRGVLHHGGGAEQVGEVAQPQSEGEERG